MKPMVPSKSLKDVSFLKGRFDILEPETTIKPVTWEKIIADEASTTTLSSLQSDFKGFNYDEILQRAKMIFSEASKPGRFLRDDQTHEYKGDAEELRWFMLPSEASDIVNNKEVKLRPVEQFPFTPGRPPQELAEYSDNRTRWWILIAVILTIITLIVVIVVVLVLESHKSKDTGPTTAATRHPTFDAVNDTAGRARANAVPLSGNISVDALKKTRGHNISSTRSLSTTSSTSTASSSTALGREMPIETFTAVNLSDTTETHSTFTDTTSPLSDNNTEISTT